MKPANRRSCTGPYQYTTGLMDICTTPDQGMSAVIDIVKDIAERVQRNKWVVARTGLFYAWLF